MILQPFVENAVIHGIEPKEGNGTIVVNGFHDENDLVFEIIDDGVGISNQKLEQLLEAKETRFTSTSSTGIGISNTNKRLIFTYGDNYKLDIKSKLGQGTVVTVRMPRSS